MAAPELNEDILRIVSDFVTDVPDLLALSLTCSSFRPLATRQLLALHPIHITGGQSIRRFHAFIFADAPARAPLLRALDIDMRPFHHLVPPQPGDASLLIDILTSCQHLERISLRRIPTAPIVDVRNPSSQKRKMQPSPTTSAHCISIAIAIAIAERPGTQSGARI